MSVESAPDWWRYNGRCDEYFVSEIVLYQSGVISAFSESKTTGMAQHVWMNPDGQSGHDGICADNLPETLSGDVGAVT